MFVFYIVLVGSILSLEFDCFTHLFVILTITEIKNNFAACRDSILSLLMN